MSAATAADSWIWQERPELAHIHAFARARMCSPWAVLGVTLCRVVAIVPPHIVLPPIVGSHASLNLFTALVGPSGAGKGAGESAAADAFFGGPDIFTATAGSGEGIAHLYAHREKGAVVRDRSAVLFTVPEVDNLVAQKERRGSTLLPQLRSAWSGERLGFAYADPTKALPIDAHTYRLGLVLGVQPGRAAPLLDDADGGTPQRFVWLPAEDPGAPDVTPPEPAPLPMPVTDGAWPSGVRGRHSLLIPQTAVDTIRATRLARVRGKGAELDGHELLCTLKVAAALALLAGRRAVTDDDWRLARVVLSVSKSTRNGVENYLAEQSREANVKRGEAEGYKTHVATEVVDDLAVRKVAHLIVGHLRQHGESSRSEELRRLNPRVRGYFDVAVDRLAAVGHVIVVETEHGTRIRPAAAA